MDHTPAKKWTRTRLVDIAAKSGFSVPTVDRVLNKRGNVKPETVRHILRVVEQLQYVPDGNASRLAKGFKLSFCVALPSTNADPGFFQKLEAEFERNRRRFLLENLTIGFRHFEERDPASVVQFFTETAPLFDGLAIITMDHPLVLEAVSGYCASGGKVVCMVSDLSRSSRQAFIGIDNRSAGKTAASLIGRFSREATGKVAVLTGPLWQLDHQDRLLGFQSVLMEDFPGLTVCEINDQPANNEERYRITADLLKKNGDLRGIYYSGTGNEPIIKAIAETNRKRQVVLVGHELTDASRVWLADGSMDAILNQNTSFIVDRTIQTLRALCSNTFSPYQVQQLAPVEIYLRDNLPPRDT
jgi:LacI family transcriptional regulator